MDLGVKKIMLVAAAMLIGAAAPSSSFGQYSPQKLNVSGALYLPSGAAVTQPSVDFKIEILHGTCVLYSEEHLAKNLSTTKGGFALEVGSGTTPQNLLQGVPALTWRVFENTGVNTGTFPGGSCVGGVTMNPGDSRSIRVSYNLGSGMTAMTPDVPISSAAYALVADTLQGKVATDLVQIRDEVGTDLSQANVENVFSATNYAKLLQLLNNSFTGGYSFNGQRITDVGSPTAATDAVNRSWVDGHVGSKVADLSGVAAGVGNGATLIWDAGGNQWVTGTPAAIDSSKLPLAGGTMSGNITMGGFDLFNVGHITMATQRMLQLGTYTSAQEGALALGTADEGKIFYNTNMDAVRMWNGSAFSGFTPGGAASGDLTGTYPGPSIATGAVSTAKIATDAVTSAKINNAGIAANRLVSSDSPTGTNLVFTGCALNEIMTFNAAGQWSCTTVTALIGASGVTGGAYGSATSVGRFGVNAQGAVTMAVDIPISFPVTSVASKTGNVILNAADIVGIRTAALEDVGVAAGNVPQLDAGGKILESLLPTTISRITKVTAGSGLLGGGTSIDVTLAVNNSAIAIEPFQINVGAATTNQVLRWNGTSWHPSAVTTGTMTLVNVGTGLTGGGLAGGNITSTGTISLTATGVTGATYGTPSSVGTFTVDAQGRLVSAVNTAIAIDPLQINIGAASTNQVLTWNGTSWHPSAVTTGTMTLVNVGSGLTGGGLAGGGR